MSSVAWIDGTARSGGTLVATGLNPDGRRVPLDLRDLAKYPARPAPLALRGQVDFRECSKARVADLASWLPPGASENHRVYSFLVGQYCVHMPALVLLRAFFRPFAAIAPALFSPRPLADVCFPRDTVDWRIDWAIPITRGLASLSSHHEAAYAWVWTYPSGRTLWHSVYRCARAGVLGLLLPRATVELVVEGELVGDAELLASRCTFLRLTPTEKPFSLAQSAPGSFRLHGLERRFGSVPSSLSLHFQGRRPAADWACEIPQDSEGRRLASANDEELASS